MMISYTAEREGLEGLAKLTEELAAKLPEGEKEETACVIHCQKRNEGFKTASKVSVRGPYREFHRSWRVLHRSAADPEGDIKL